MKPEQQRIKIAEALGWKHIQRLQSGWHGCQTQGPLEELPYYPEDLNAMHEAVSIFDYDQADEFEEHLCDICKRSNDKKDNPAPWRFAVINATAAQRAEAFLRTLNLWES